MPIENYENGEIMAIRLCIIWAIKWRYAILTKYMVNEWYRNSNGSL